MRILTVICSGVGSRDTCVSKNVEKLSLKKVLKKSEDPGGYMRILAVI